MFVLFVTEEILITLSRWAPTSKEAWPNAMVGDNLPSPVRIIDKQNIWSSAPLPPSGSGITVYIKGH